MEKDSSYLDLIRISLGILCIVIISIIIFFILAKKPVQGYYLTGNIYGSMTIKVDIDNCFDETIILNGISYEDAVELVNSLNQSLKK